MEDISNSWSDLISWEVPPEGFDVSLHIYDISMGLAAMLSSSIIGKKLDGIWHTGIVVYGKEFFYGGGICVDAPSRTPYGTPKTVLPLGLTQVPPALFADFLLEASSRYQMEHYSLLTHNCNNFTDECSTLLLGTGIPSYIVDLPNEALSTPMGQMIAPLIQQFEQSMHGNMALPIPPSAPLPSQDSSSHPSPLVSSLPPSSLDQQDLSEEETLQAAILLSLQDSPIQSINPRLD